MQKWEYATYGAFFGDILDNRARENCLDGKRPRDFLNEMGREGWRLVNVIGHAGHSEILFFLERPVEEHANVERGQN